MSQNSEVQISYDLAREEADLTVATITRVFENGFKVLASLEGDDAMALIDAWNKRPDQEAARTIQVYQERIRDCERALDTWDDHKDAGYWKTYPYRIATPSPS